MLQTRLQTGVCETLMLDVMAPEAHQNNCSYVHQLSRPTLDSIQHGGWLHEGPQKKNPLNCQNWGVGTCMRVDACPGQYGMYI